MADQIRLSHLSTICAADAVGFSRLMNLDAEAAVQVFEARRAIVEETVEAFGGHLFGAAGDSLMSEYYNPLDAVRAAQEFQRRLALANEGLPADEVMEFRVGIATGVVFYRGEAIFGDCVNISARLQSLAPPGGIAITDGTFAHLKGRMNISVTDLGPIGLKNIALPVGVLLLSDPTVAAQARNAVPPIAPEPTPESEDSGLPAIAVLPFDNLDPATLADYFADGIADELTHGLSATRALPVIASSSSFQFRDRSIGLQLIGRLLRARYIVTGSVISAGDRIRVSASLSDSSSGHLVWSGRFEHEKTDLMQLQDELGHEIVSVLESEVDRLEQVRTFQAPWEKLSTWQLVRRGRWHMQRRSRRDMQRAFELFSQACEEDPYSSAALIEIGWWYLWRSWLQFANPVDLEKVVEYAQRAILVDSQDARAYTLIGFAELLRGNLDASLVVLKQALHYNPSHAPANQAIGSALLLSLRPQEAIQALKRADKLSPYEHFRFHSLGELAAAHFQLKDWPNVIASAERSLALAQDYFYPRFLMVGAFGRLGDVAAARRGLDEFRARHPKFDRKWIDWIPFKSRAPLEDMHAAYEDVLQMR